MRFIVEPGMGINYWLGTNTVAPRHFEHWIQPGMTVYDVGANKGQMTLMFAALVGSQGRVVAIEPAPVEFDRLQQNVRVNRLSQVQLSQVAAAHVDGSITFTYDEDHPTQGKLLEVEPSYVNPGAERMTVEAIRLDSLLGKENPPDIIKIDVEGGAAAVLRGATRILEETSPRIYLELHGPEEQAAVQEELLSRGFLAETLSGEIVRDPQSNWFSPLWCYKTRR